MLAASMDSYLENLDSELDPGMLEMILMVYGGFLLLTLAFAVVSYVLHSVGLYTIARRRRIPRPWLAFLPIGGNWILGSISDRYQFVRKKRFRNRKKLLVCMELATYVLTGAIVFSIISLLINAGLLQTTAKLPDGWYTVDGLNLIPLHKDQSFIGPIRPDDILAAAQLIVVLFFATLLISMIFTIFLYLTYYDVYASCRPDLKVVFLLLSILFPVTMPFFVFACRKHDKGLEEQPKQENSIAGIWAEESA